MDIKKFSERSSNKIKKEDERRIFFGETHDNNGHYSRIAIKQKKLQTMKQFSTIELKK